MCNTIGCMNFDIPATLCGECTWWANKKDKRIAELEAELASQSSMIEALANELSDASMNDVQWKQWAEAKASEKSIEQPKREEK